MAKKVSGDGVNKSQLIRQYMDENPSAGPKAIVEAMKSLHNIDVKAQFVSTIKSNDKRKGNKPAGKRGRKPGSVSSAKATKSAGNSSSSGTITIESLLAAKAFIQKIGGLKKAKAAVDLLAGLSD